MEKEPTKIEDPSSQLATKIATALEALVGVHEWSGDNPYEIRMVNSGEGTAFIYKIGKGDNWITIQERASDNPLLVRTFLLENKDNQWTYVDGRLLKHGESSLSELEAAYAKLRVAIEASATKELEGPKKELE